MASFEISTHALREEGDQTLQLLSGVPRLISTHALREEGDIHILCYNRYINNFYPRPPRGGRPVVRPPIRRISNFYPRPPRGGRPASPPGSCPWYGHFYPRPPRGGRPSSWNCWKAAKPFLPTPSARRATNIAAIDTDQTVDFYPRPPRGGRQLAACFHALYLRISTHALREEGDMRFLPVVMLS